MTGKELIKIFRHRWESAQRRNNSTTLIQKR